MAHSFQRQFSEVNLRGDRLHANSPRQCGSPSGVIRIKSSPVIPLEISLNTFVTLEKLVEAVPAAGMDCRDQRRSLCNSELYSIAKAIASSWDTWLPLSKYLASCIADIAEARSSRYCNPKRNVSPAKKNARLATTMCDATSLAFPITPTRVA